MDDRSTQPILALKPGLLAMPPGLGEHAREQFAPLAGLLRVLFARWDDAGLHWVVLRNADELPDYTRYDVDILVQPDHLGPMLSILEEVVRDKGGQVSGRIEKRFYTCVLLQRGSVEEGVQFLPLDFFTALEFRGNQYLDVGEALAARLPAEQGVWTLPPVWDATVTLLKEWLPHGRLKENSRDAVHAGALQDPEAFQDLLKRSVGELAGGRLAALTLQRGWDGLAAVPRPAPKAMAEALDWCRAAWANVRHLFRPSLGMVVALAGADGSGKSTLASELAMRLYKRPFKGCRYIHGNIGVLPRFRDIRAFVRRAIRRRAPVSVSPEPETLKGMMTPIPAWKSMLLATYYAMDLMLARLLIRRWRGQWMLVLMDRSFYDYFYQLGHRNCPEGFLRGLTCLIPKPDLLICVEGDPNAIHARKPELTVEEIEREQTILAALAESLPFACRIDGRDGVEAMVTAAETRVLQALFKEGRP